MAPTKVSSNYISDDIAFSILSKLPVKSVNRFSCVHKSWSLLFENPNFITMFLNNLINKSQSLNDDACLILNQAMGSYNWNFYLISGNKFENKVKFDLPPSLHPQRQRNGLALFRVLGSSINGILCIYDCFKNWALLWNPATEEVKAIPPSIVELPNVTTQINLHGFGYDHVKDDYKIIQYMCCFTLNDCGDLEHELFWEIYSLKSNSWRKINFDMPNSYRDPVTGVYSNGVCHWWGHTNKKACLVSFNLCNEVYFITPSPLEEDVPGCFDVNLLLLHESVSMISNHKNTKSFKISILGEIGVKESWIQLFNVEPLSCIVYPIGTGKKGNVFFRKENHQLASFDLTTGVIEDIEVKGESLCQMVIFKKNLHPIRGTEN